MCGLWASAGFEPPDAVIDRVAHRGPDGAGRFDAMTLCGPLSFRFRRLAIYDISPAGHQPMTSADGRLVIVFNGAIYNFRILRDELVAQGHMFVTNSDTEVLLAAFAQWGEACLARLNGIFAGVIFDRANSRLFAFRDRFGVKPLHIWQQDGKVAFASEAKQILALDEIRPRYDHDAMRDFLAHGLTDHTDKTCFVGIHHVPAGSSITIDLADANALRRGALPAQRWYALPASAGKPLPLDQALHEVSHAFEQAIRFESVADVPVGSCLSGGVDSSAIVGAVSSVLDGAPHHAVSAVFPGFGIDESRHVDAVAAHLPSLQLHRLTPDPGRMADALDQVIWHQEQPFGSTSILVQWAVFEGAREAGLTVMLDGQGADELFGGYPPVIGAFVADLVRSGQILRLKSEMQALQSRHHFSQRQLAYWMGNALAPRWLMRSARLALERLMPGGGMLRWLKDSPLWPAHAGVEQGMDGHARQMLTQASVPMLLRFEDRNSMAHGIEARVPFLDHVLVETVLAAHSAYNIRNGELKWLEREALSRFLPPAIRNRHDKIGFAAPEKHWIEGAMRGKLVEGLEAALETFGAILDTNRTRLDIVAMREGRLPYHSGYWRLACAGLWARRFGVSG